MQREFDSEVNYCQLDLDKDETQLLKCKQTQPGTKRKLLSKRPQSHKPLPSTQLALLSQPKKHGEEEEIMKKMEEERELAQCTFHPQVKKKLIPFKNPQQNLYFNKKRRGKTIPGCQEQKGHQGARDEEPAEEPLLEAEVAENCERAAPKQVPANPAGTELLIKKRRNSYCARTTSRTTRISSSSPKSTRSRRRSLRASRGESTTRLRGCSSSPKLTFKKGSKKSRKKRSS